MTPVWTFCGAQVVRFAVRTKGGSLATLGTIRAMFEKNNSQQTIYGVQTLENLVSDSVAWQRFTMTLLGAFAMLAVLLVSIGVYGVISYVVGQRTHEIGLRIALGAYRFDVLRLLVGESVAMAIVGVTVGIGASFGLTRLLAKMLYGVSAHDPITFVACGVLLVECGSGSVVRFRTACNARRSGCSSASRIDFSRVNSG